MLIYRFDQNNSFGVFHPPVINNQPDTIHERIWSKGNDVYVLAESPQRANELAEKHSNVYFDGDGDCPCCGNRWYRFWDHDTEANNYSIHDPIYMSAERMNQHAVPSYVREIYAPEAE